MPLLSQAAPEPTVQAAYVATLEKLLANDVLRQQLAKKAYHHAVDFSHRSTFERWHYLIDQTLATTDS